MTRLLSVLGEWPTTAWAAPAATATIVAATGHRLRASSEPHISTATGTLTHTGPSCTAPVRIAPRV